MGDYEVHKLDVRADDDLASILNSIPSNTEVVLGEGTHTITDPVVLSGLDNVTIRGSSASIISASLSAALDSLITIAGCSNLSIRGMTYSITSDADQRKVIDFTTSDSSDINISDITLRTSAGTNYSYFVYGNDNVKISDLHIGHVAGTGYWYFVYLQAGSSAGQEIEKLFVSHCSITNDASPAGSVAVRLNGNATSQCTACRIVDNYFDNFNVGINASDCSHLDVLNNRVLGVDGNSRALTAEGSYGRVLGNYFEHVGVNVAVRIGEGDFIDFSNNTVVQDNASAYDILLVKNSDTSIIANNIFVGMTTAASGVSEENVTNSNFADNTIRDVTENGFEEDADCDGNEYSDNRFSGITLDRYAFSGTRQGIVRTIYPFENLAHILNNASGNGERFVLSEGDYDWDDQVVINGKSNITVDGSRATQINVSYAAGSPLVFTGNCSNIRFTGFEVTNSPASGCHPFAAIQGTGTISNLAFDDIGYVNSATLGSNVFLGRAYGITAAVDGFSITNCDFSGTRLTSVLRIEGSGLFRHVDVSNNHYERVATPQPTAWAASTNYALNDLVIATENSSLGNWTVNTAYNVGDVVRAPTGGNYFQCIVAGTSDPTTEPTWDNTDGNTTNEVSGTVVWYALYNNNYSWASMVYRCVADAGSSGTYAPPWKKVVGQETVDGALTWKCEGSLAVFDFNQIQASNIMLNHTYDNNFISHCYALYLHAVYYISNYSDYAVEVTNNRIADSGYGAVVLLALNNVGGNVKNNVFRNITTTGQVVFIDQTSASDIKPVVSGNTFNNIIGGDCLFFRARYGGTCDGNDFTTYTGYGVRSNIADGLVISNNVFYGGQYGYYDSDGSGSADNSTLSGNTARGQSVAGFYANQAGNWTVTGNQVYGSAGYGFQGFADSQFVGNVADGCNYGFSCGPRNTYIGNLACGNAIDGFNVNQIGVILIGNRAGSTSRSNGNGRDGFRIENGGDDCIVTGNYAYDNVGYGIDVLSGATGCRIHDNYTSLNRKIVAEYPTYGTTPDTGTTTQSLGNYAGTYNGKVAQSFQVTSSGLIRGVKAWLQRVGTLGTITARIETNSAGAPSGTLVHPAATVTMPISTSKTLQKAWFTSAFKLATGTTYWLVLSLPSDPGSGAYARLWKDSASSYGSGLYRYYTAAWANGTEIVDAGFAIMGPENFIASPDSTIEGVKVKKIAYADTPYYVRPSDQTIFADASSGAVTLNLPAIVQSYSFRVVNAGASGNVTVTPDGTDKLLGAAASWTLAPGESLIISADTTLGWF